MLSTTFVLLVATVLNVDGGAVTRGARARSERALRGKPRPELLKRGVIETDTRSWR